MTNIYKKFTFVDFESFKCLIKSFFREIDFKNIYTKNIKNKKIINMSFKD